MTPLSVHFPSSDSAPQDRASPLKGMMPAKSGPRLASPDLNRRDFLRRAAIGLAGVATDSLARAADLPEKMSSPTTPRSVVGSNFYGNTLSGITNPWLSKMLSQPCAIR